MTADTPDTPPTLDALQQRIAEIGQRFALATASAPRFSIDAVETYGDTVLDDVEWLLASLLSAQAENVRLREAVLRAQARLRELEDRVAGALAP